MMLPELLTQKANKLSTEFGELSNTKKKVLLIRHLQSKAEKLDALKKTSNIAVSQAVAAN